MRFLILLLTTFTALGAARAQAHEFWLSPRTYQVESGAPVVADLRLGQEFSGAPMSFLPGRITQFRLFQGEIVTDIASRLGDRPAMSQPAPGDGLAIIIHETTDHLLTYSEWSKFESFVTDKAFPDALRAHARRNLPQRGFQESYRRYAKALVAIGNGHGQDRPIGMQTEIVARANPFTDDISKMPVQVLYQGQPRAGAQLEVFERAPNGKVTITRLRTDQDGATNVPVLPGHEYLLDAVILRDTGNDDVSAGPVWHSLWAALTFAIPLE